MHFFCLVVSKFKTPIMQQYQGPDGNYLLEVNVVLQDAGSLLASDPATEVTLIVVAL